MAITTNTGGDSDIGDAVTRLTEMGDRTSLMVIDATLRVLPDAGGPLHLGAVGELRDLARRMLQATHDFRAAIHEPAE